MRGKQYGLELKLNYAGRDLSAYVNVAFQGARGEDINTTQFNFGADDLAYISNRYIHLDHEQAVSASACASYLLQGTRLSAEAILGTGLRADETLPDGTGIPNGAHLPTHTQVNLGASHKFQLGNAGDLTLRLDVMNPSTRSTRSETARGVGVGASQYGPRRGFFFGISKSI